MKLVIPAAGCGSRLMPHTKNLPKCLLKIGNQRILEYNLENFSNNGLNNIVIITGYKHNKFEKLIGPNYKSCCIKYIYNENYSTTDNMYSLWLAKDVIKNGFIFVNSDVIINQTIIQNILSTHYPNTCMIDDKMPLKDDNGMKVRIESDKKIIKFGRNLKNPDGRAIGLYKFSKSGSNNFFDEISRYINSGINNLKVEAALENFIKKNNLNVIKTNNAPWIEIDEEQDLNQAILMKKSF